MRGNFKAQHRDSLDEGDHGSLSSNGYSKPQGYGELRYLSDIQFDTANVVLGPEVPVHCC